MSEKENNKKLTILQDREFNEFENDPLNMSARSVESFSDEFVFRKAKIYQVLGPKDDRLQVQVLPELQGMDDAEMDDLPKYPPFIKGEVITGRSHKEDGDKAEYVWVICTPDLQVGYIIGKCNIFGEPNKKYPDSYSWKDVKSFLRERRALPEDFDYAHMQVVHWFAGDKGGMIEMYNYLTGDWILLNTAGSIITLQQQKIYIRVGSPGENGPAAFSAITMVPDKIHIKCVNFELDAQKSILGHHGLQAVGTASAGIIVGRNGVSIQSLDNIVI